MKKAIVYSALHTGTWFTCNILTEATKEHADYRSDRWVNKGAAIATEKDPENPDQDNVIEKAMKSGNIREFDSLLIKQKAKGLTIKDEIEAFILQAHNRSNSPFYNYIDKFKPEISVVIPFRDPFLSINTRIWRELGSMELLQEEHMENRTNRVRDQIASIIRLLSIKDKHVLKYAMDIHRTEDQKINIINKIINYAGFTPDPIAVKDIAEKWEPVNTTINGMFAQKTTKLFKKDDFILTKNAIIDGNIKLIEKFMLPELELTRTMLANFRPILEELGYTNLHWW